MKVKHAIYLIECEELTMTNKALATTVLINDGGKKIHTDMTCHYFPVCHF